jgi:RHS repeat-associated protein
VEYVYDLVGKLQQVTDPTGTYGFAYDNMGRLVGTTTQYTFVTGTYTNAYTYDADSNRASMTDPEGGVTSYVYDTLNRLSTLTPPSAFGNSSFGFTYDALSRRTQMTRPNGVTTNYTYNNLSQLLSVLHQVGTSTIDGATYTVDPAGSRTAKTDDYANVTSNYTYDPLYELTQVTQATNTTESYSYDPVGNRSSSLGVSPYSVNSSNELTSTPSATYAYDNNGNILTKVTSAGTTTYSWDYENRLTSVTLPGTGGTLAFKYDGLGRRVQKVFTQNSTSTTTNYLYDGNNAVADVDQNGNVLARYMMTQHIDEPLAELRSGATSYYSLDGLDSVSSLTTSTGALSNTYRYDSFGNLTASSGSITNRFQYTAREFDTETGLYHYRARYYDPSSARFLSEDPIGFVGGLNFYGYVNSNPINWIDPMGLQRSKEQCAKDLADLIKKAGKLAKEISKYNPILDGQGGPGWKSGGHYHEIGELKQGLWNDVANYLNRCRDGGNGPIPPCVFESAKKWIPPPIVPNPAVPTQFELEMDVAAAGYQYAFWQDIVYGDGFLLGAVGGIALAPAGGGASVLVPAFQ